MNLIRFNRLPFHHGLLNNFENDFLSFDKKEGTIPAVNIHENDKHFVLEFAVPGMNKDDFKIGLDNQVLTVHTENKKENEERETSFTRREFLYTNFNRSFSLPKSIDTHKIKADYTDGILTISLPKSKETKLSREIKIS